MASEFPLVSIGLDLEDLSRWRQTGLRVLDPDSRIFSAAERAYCDRQADPVPHYAARWCAKEAVVKALAPLARVHVTEVELVADGGAPKVAWRQGAAPAGLVSIAVSLTHTEATAGAVAVAQYMPKLP